MAGKCAPEVAGAPAEEAQTNERETAPREKVLGDIELYNDLYIRSFRFERCSASE